MPYRNNDPVSIWTGKDRKFTDPFIMPSNSTFPTEFSSALDFCLYLYFLNPLYKKASERVVSHFVTDVEFEGKDGDEDERDELKSFLTTELDVFGMMLEMGQEWACFAGDTKVITRDGVVPISSLVNKEIDVLSKNGVYRKAKFSSYGKQPLMEVVFSDNKKVYATPNHNWEVRNLSGKIVEATTVELRPGYSIQRTVAGRPSKNEEYYEGVRHGFIYGDGSMSSKNKRTTALFVGHKDQIMLQYFVPYGNTPRVRSDRPDQTRISGFPANFKTLPETSKSSEYWYGFVSGFLAADGHVDKRDGCASIAQRDEAVLNYIAEQLPRIGMVAGPVKKHMRKTGFGGEQMCSVTLLKQFMVVDDFLIEQHRINFLQNNNKTNYGKFIGIKAINPTNRVEEVFCAEENETHRFVIDNGILTGNCYGNSFVRIHFPFDRVLVDTRGMYTEYALATFGNDVKYDYKTLRYDIPDPKTFHLPDKQRKRVSLPFIERPAKDKKRIKLKKIDPRRVTLNHSFISGRTQVQYRFEESLIKQIKDSVLFQVNETPMAMLKAISKDQDFLFNDNQVFHFKAPTISGVSNSGWGMPETIANYRYIHQLQIYRKIDEAVGLDYMLPFRLFSPGDSANMSNVHEYNFMGPWVSNIEKIIKSRRADPFAIHAFPFPVTYQEFGAEGKNLTPKDLIEFQTNDMLDAMGYPAELFRGTLQVQQIPTAMRLFENSFHFIYHNFSNFLKWSVGKISDYLNLEQIGVALQMPRIADDLEKRQVYLQLAASQEIPRSIAYQDFGIKDPVEAAKQRAQEDMEIQEEQAKLQQEFERKQTVGSMDALMQAQAEQGAQQGSMPGGGSVPGTGGGNVSPLDIQNQAMQIAQTMIPMSDGERQKQYDALKATNENLHAAVKQKVEELTNQAASQGKQMARSGQM